MSRKNKQIKIEIESNNSQTSQEIKAHKLYSLNCACCNQDIKDTYIGIIYYGTMVHLCGQPCGVKDYLDTQ
jgi:hypothetical protein